MGQDKYIKKAMEDFAEKAKQATEFLKNNQVVPYEVDATTRKSVLEKAMQIVTTDRGEQYGTPEDSFSEIAKALTWLLDIEITPSKAALIMCLFKISRIKTGRFKADNYVDLIGYAACGAELEGLE